MDSHPTQTKQIQVVKQIAGANRYQQEEVYRVIGKILIKNGKQKTKVLKYLEAVPYVGKYNDKVVKAFKELDVNVGISNKIAIRWRGLANDDLL